jgi:hypothetical protein
MLDIYKSFIHELCDDSAAVNLPYYYPLPKIKAWEFHRIGSCQSYEIYYKLKIS